MDEYRILIVDDEAPLCQMVQELLHRNGYTFVDTAGDCAESLRKCGEQAYDLILLDGMLPDGDGFDLYEKLPDCPIIFLSARDQDPDRLRGLGLGADDYIVKPFLPEELLLRIRAVLRRTYPSAQAEKKDRIGAAMVDWKSGTVIREEKEFVLTAKEYALLKKLCENRGHILSINVLCDTLWPDGSFGYENSLMVHIRRIREKIEKDPSNPVHLITLRGLGYKLI